MLLIELAAIMGHPICDNQIADTKIKVIEGNLIENLLGDFHLGRFTLDNHQWIPFLREKYDIGTEIPLVDL